MIKADAATVSWDPDKKEWKVRIQVGEEIIKRPCGKKVKHDAGDDTLKSLAVETARDDGYEVDPGQITIAR